MRRFNSSNEYSMSSQAAACPGQEVGQKVTHSACGQKKEMAMWPTCGQNGYITLAVSRVPNAQQGDKNQKCLRDLTCGQSGYIIPAVSVVPNAQCGDKNQKWLCGPHVGKMAASLLPS